MLNLDTLSCPCPSGQGSERSCAHHATSVIYLGSVEESGQKMRMGGSGHVKSMINLFLVRCKMLNISIPDINDKLIPILSSFFFGKEQKG